jgi:hypothetical protein
VGLILMSGSVGLGISACGGSSEATSSDTGGSEGQSSRSAGEEAFDVASLSPPVKQALALCEEACDRVKDCVQEYTSSADYDDCLEECAAEVLSRGPDCQQSLVDFVECALDEIPADVCQAEEGEAPSLDEVVAACSSQYSSALQCGVEAMDGQSRCCCDHAPYSCWATTKAQCDAAMDNSQAFGSYTDESRNITDNAISARKECLENLEEALGTCIPSARRCDGNRVQVCSLEDQWVTVRECDQHCKNGACQVCVTGLEQCTNGRLERCYSGIDGGGWLEVGPCDTDESTGAFGTGGLLAPGAGGMVAMGGAVLIVGSGGVPGIGGALGVGGASCGNGMIDVGETCDPPATCPVSCDDGNACTVDELTGSAMTCNISCNNSVITTCASGDGCCPVGCMAAEDTDCAVGLGG